MYTKLGYDYFYDKSSYEIDETIGFGLSDKSFVKQSVQKLKKLEKDSYELLDIRSEVEISHGAIPGAIAVKPEEIEKKLKRNVKAT